MERQEKSSGWENVKQAEDQSLFADVSSESPVTELESLCMACEQQGVTRLLLTKVPFFREIVLMSFCCPHCNWRNNEVQSATSIEEKGCRFEFTVSNSKSLNRQCVKSNTATIYIPELQLEVPAITQKGTLNNIEGYLVQTADALESSNDDRRKADPVAADQVAKFVTKVREFAEGKHFPFHFVLDDPAGNSVVQNPCVFRFASAFCYAPKEDPEMKVVYYTRTHDQNNQIGVTYLDASDNPVDAPDEVFMLPTECSMCGAAGYLKSILEDIPHFREVLLMAFACNNCGYKTNEVKGGGPIPPKGKKLKLQVLTQEDLKRDILKSDSASVTIPEIELELAHGTLGGKFTTIEGLLRDIHHQLRNLPFFAAADSIEAAGKEKTADKEALSQKDNYAAMLKRLEDLRLVREPFTVLVEDPLAASYIQNPNAPDPDPQLECSDYERSWDEDEEHGIHDLKKLDEDERAAGSNREAGKP